MTRRENDAETERMERREMRVRQIIDAMVLSKHADVMEVYGLPQGFFSTPKPEVVGPEDSFMRPVRPMKVVSDVTPAEPKQYSSVLRGDRPVRLRGA